MQLELHNNPIPNTRLFEPRKDMYFLVRAIQFTITNRALAEKKFDPALIVAIMAW